jgi:hypothetical protein
MISQIEMNAIVRDIKKQLIILDVGWKQQVARARGKFSPRRLDRRSKVERQSIQDDRR